jgi:glycosyltransferase involved in cell wall biosynthesis
MAVKKVLLAIGSLSGGGAERVVCEWANDLSERGYQVAILVFCRTFDEYYLSDKVKIYSCAGSVEEYLHIPYFKRYLYFRETIKQFHPDYLIPFLFSMRFWMFVSTLGLGIKRIETIRINPWVKKTSFIFVNG